jgi:orotate phosphoribosyltransferase
MHPTFPTAEAIAELTAKMLLELKAIVFNAEQPFKFTSGWASPVYIDCKKLISYPRARQIIMSFAESTILREVGFESIDAVAGGESAGIPYAAWLADRLMLPMQFVRKRAKGFGPGAQIEGKFKVGDRILLVEDLTTDGHSKIRFCKALRDAGAQVRHTFVLFQYGIFPQTRELLEKNKLKMMALANWWDVLEACKKARYFDNSTIAEIEEYLHDPVAWSSAHGGAFEFTAD